MLLYVHTFLNYLHMGLNHSQVLPPIEKKQSPNTLDDTLFRELPSLQQLGKILRDCGFLRKGEKAEEAVKRLGGSAAEALITVIHAIHRSKRGEGKHPSRTGIIDDKRVLNPNTYLNEQIVKLGTFLAKKLAQHASDNITNATAGTRNKILDAMRGNI